MREESKVYVFTDEDNPNKRPVGGRSPFCPSYGFWFDGDESRPRGLYSNDGIFYGNEGIHSEISLTLDELVTNRARLARGLLDIAKMAPSPETFQAASEGVNAVLAGLNEDLAVLGEGIPRIS